MLSPLAGQISAGTIDVFANIPKMLCRVEQVHDLHRLGKVLRGDVPNPLRSVANHHLTFGILKILPRRFALDTAGERRDHFVSFQGARRFNCSTIADRPRIARRKVVRVAPVSAPQRHDSYFAVFCRTVGLLARTSGGFAFANWDAGVSMPRYRVLGFVRSPFFPLYRLSPVLGTAPR